MFYTSMKINSIQNNQRNIKFKGLWAVSGEKKAIQKIQEMIGTNLGEDLIPYKFRNIGGRNNQIICVATSYNTDEINKPWVKDFLKTKTYDATELLDPRKTIELSFLDGFHEQVKILFKDGMQYVCSNIFQQHKTINNINIVKFPKPINLLEGISKLATEPRYIPLSDGKTYEFKHNKLWHLLNHRAEIKNSPELNKFKITGFHVGGTFSSVFEMPNKKCLKLSFFPNAPYKDAIYDAKTISREKIDLLSPEEFYFKDCDHIYYTVTKKGENNKEHRITRENVDSVKNKFYSINHQYNTQDLDGRQIALFDNEEALLVDAQVSESRPLFL